MRISCGFETKQIPPFGKLSVGMTKVTGKEIEMASKISILCPTRGRPESLKRLLESIEATAARIPEVILYIDDDDETMRDFVYRGQVKKVVGPRIHAKTARGGGPGLMALR